MSVIKVERIYTKPADTAGYRILIDRLWPRGVSKVNAALDWWAKEIAPSTELREWFHHDPALFAEFTQKYQAELEANNFTAEFVAKVKVELQTQDVILLYGAKDQQDNQAVVLKEYLAKVL